MYQVQESVRPDGTSQPNLFSTTDEKWHTMVMRPVSPYLSSNRSVLGVEKFLDSSISLLLRLLNEKFVDTGRPCDISERLLRCKSHYAVHACSCIGARANQLIVGQSRGMPWQKPLLAPPLAFSTALSRIMRLFCVTRTATSNILQGYVFRAEPSTLSQ